MTFTVVQPSSMEQLQQTREELAAAYQELKAQNIQLQETKAAADAANRAKANRLKIVAVSASVLMKEQQAYLDAGFDDFIPKPLRAEQIYTCLANLLRVTYVYAASAEAREGPNLEKITLPPNLRSRLLEAAKFGRIAELEGLISEVRQLGQLPYEGRGSLLPSPLRGGAGGGVLGHPISEKVVLIITHILTTDAHIFPVINHGARVIPSLRDG